MLTVFLVDSLADSGTGTLRQAIVDANADTTDPSDDIVFDNGLTGTIDLASSLPAITDALTITGPGQDLLTIDAGKGTDEVQGNGDGFRIFEIDDGDDTTKIDVELIALSLVGGDTVLEGGAILNRENATLTDSTIANNHADSGGGIYNDADAEFTLQRSTVSGNTAAISGGGASNYGNLTVRNSTMVANNGENYAGAIDNVGTTHLINSTLSQNFSVYGGGIYNVGEANLDNTTLTGNSAAQGFGVFNAASGSLNSTNSIIRGDVFGTGTLNSSFSLIGLSPNPMLGPLADNGGPTQTHAPLPGSPAIDMGDPAFDGNAFTPSLVTDQRGAPFQRIVAGRVDIGAVEYIDLVVDTLDDENDNDFGMNDFSLREAVELANTFDGSQTITFAPALSGGSILLTLGALIVTDSVSIDASALDDYVTVDAQNASRVIDITTDSGDSSIIGLSLINGASADDGGAVRFLSTENLSVTRSKISGSASAGNGGGIFSEGSVTLTDSTVDDNDADSMGGGVFANNVSAVGSTISNNRSTSSVGGGIYATTVDLTRSTVSGNESNLRGGGVVGTNVTLQQTTIADNHAFTDGGGVTAGSLIAANSIIAQNSASGTNPDVSVTVSITALDYSLIGDTSGTSINAGTGTGNILDTNAMLDSLADKGGLTLVHTPQQASPAIDMGDPGVLLDPNVFDQRGTPFTRVVGGRIDMGAVESRFANVLDRHVFYNDSAFDQNNSAANADDDDAIAPDKNALLPGNQGMFENQTSFSSGINGIMIDVQNLGTPSLTLDDFEFQVGEPNAWIAAPAPVEIKVRSGEGMDGSDRISIVWTDGSIVNTWLQVTLKSTERTGLATDDVFYFGNLVGDTNGDADQAVTDFGDLQSMFTNVYTVATIASVFDIDRDETVDFTDLQLAFANVYLSLTMISV